MSIALEASSASTDSHFEIVDFTAASPWERFIAQLEAAIRKWMSGDAATSGDGATTGPGDGTSRSNNVEVTLDRHVFRLEWHRLDGRHKCVGYSIDATTRSTTSSVDNCDAQTSTFLTNELETGSSPLLDTHELHRLAGYRDFLLLVPVHVAPSIVAATTGGGSSSRTPSTSRSRTRTRTSSPSARTPLLGLTSALARITDAGVTAVSHAAATVSAAATAAAASVAASTLPAATVDLALGKLVMSSAAIALGNTECKMPVFVQMGPLWRRLYAGVQCLRDVETRLRTTHMPYVPRGYHDLAGAVRLFHATFKCELEGDADHDEGEVVATRVTPKITAAIRYTFVRDEFDDQQWRGALLPSTATWPRLTAGCRYDPIDALTLIAEWPPMPVDNLANMEQLRPADAALWFVRGDTEVHDGNPGALPGMAMSRCLERMMWCMADGTPSTLASLRDRGYANGVSMVDRVDVDMLVDRLFANQQNDHGDMESDVSDMRDPAAMEDPIFVVPTPAELAAQFRHSASTPYRGFIWRLALEIAHLLQGMPSHDHLIPAVRPLLSVVWLEIIRELRYRWTYKKWTPNVVTRVVVEAGDSVAAGIGRRTVVKGDSALNGVSVDTRHALIVQKLSMLNACVYRHHRRGTGGNARLSNADVAKVMDVEDRRERRRRREDLESVSAATEEVVSDDAPSVNATRVKMTQEGVGHAENIAHDLLKDDWKWDDEDEEQGKEEQVASRKTTIASDVSSDAFFDAHEDLHQSSPSQTSPPPPIQAQPRQTSPIDIINPRVRSLSHAGQKQSHTQLHSASSLGSSYDHVGLPVPATPSPDIPAIDHNRSSSTYVMTDSNAREGHLYVLGDLTLIETGEPLWVPETQESGYMTEDMLADVQKEFERLGTGADAAKVRARMQSAQLRSDMEAFKAANPGCILEDFVRWHSPRDWLPGDDNDNDATTTTHHLSTRMTEPGNLWQELWATTRRVPAVHQHPLFDHLQEGERALQWLEAVDARVLVRILQPTLYLVFYEALFPGNDIGVSRIPPILLRLPFVRERFADIARRLASFQWEGVDGGNHDDDANGEAMKNGHDHFENVLDLLERFRILESMVACAISLLDKFGKARKNGDVKDRNNGDDKDRTNGDVKDRNKDSDENRLPPALLNIVDQLLRNRFANDPRSLKSVQLHATDEERTAVSRIFFSTSISHEPRFREYVLHHECKRDHGPVLEQRMHVSVRDGDFRVVECRSKDVSCG